MPTEDDREARDRAERDERQGKAPSTQAGEFVREEIKHVREGRHGARNTKQLIAIGLSKARRAGVKLPPPGKGSSRTRRKAARDLRRGRAAGARRTVSKRRSRATERALRHEGSRSASRRTLSLQARRSSRKRGRAARRRAALKAVHTKGKAGLRRAARKAARTRHHHAA